MKLDHLLERAELLPRTETPAVAKEKLKEETYPNVGAAAIDFIERVADDHNPDNYWQIDAEEFLKHWKG